MSQEDSSNRLSKSRRGFLKKVGVTASVVPALSTTASATTYRREFWFHGNNDTKHSKDYKLTLEDLDSDLAPEATTVDSKCESDDGVSESDTDGWTTLYGNVYSSGEDVFLSNGVINRFKFYEEVDLEIYEYDGSFKSSYWWDLSVGGSGDYTIVFAGDEEPNLVSGESEDSTGINSNGYGYITGSTKDGGNVNDDDVDSYRVEGDIRRVLLEDVGDYFTMNRA